MAIWSALFLVATLGAITAAWAAARPDDDLVPRNVALAGRPVGELSATELRSVVLELADEYAAAPVRIDAPRGGFTTTAHALGLAVQVDETLETALALDRSGPLPARVAGWLRSFVTQRPAPVLISVDPNAVYREVSANDPGPKRPATEPSVQAANGELVAVQGSPGAGIDPAHVLAVLPRAARNGLPIEVSVRRGRVLPRYSFQDAETLVHQAEILIRGGIRVRAEHQQTTIGPEDLRLWIRSEATDEGLRVRLDHQSVNTHLRQALDDPDPEPVNARYDVVEGNLVVVPGQSGRGCCDEAAGGLVEAALIAGERGPVELPITDIAPPTTDQDLEGDGISEEVATFTTNHAAGQPRVRNIQLMADLVRGQVIQPGETFSINEFVGERTREKGFVVDGVIQNGRFTTSVGGGVSQFATTLFNAAFFAGMEFPEYQSHSIYISRYPYGREATLSYPRPDLQVQNPSPHPVLIWTSYTPSSITVGLYSTKWVEVEQTGQTETPRGPCRLVRTERTATYLADGDTKVDRVIALYRPAEGVNCA